MFVYNIIAAEGMEMASTLEGPLHGTLPADKLKAVQDAREVLVKMLERLNQTGDSGWGNYPVVPAGGITKPRLGEVESYVDDAKAKYIEWPAIEYAMWQVAWKYIAETTMGLFGSEATFPLGDKDTILSSIDTRYVEGVKAAPTATRAAAAIVTLLLKLQRQFTNLPEHPRIKGSATTSRKPSFLGKTSPWTIIGLLAAAAVGGALIYARKKNKWPFAPWGQDAARPRSSRAERPRPSRAARAMGRAEDTALLWELSRWGR